MQTAIILVQMIAGLLLIAFGGLVTWQGIRLITRYYPLTLKPGPVQPQALTGRAEPSSLVEALLALVTAEIAALPERRLQGKLAQPHAADGTPGGVGRPVPVVGAPAVQPVDPVEPVEPTIPASGAAGCQPSDILNSAAGLIESLPKLLNANFGPAAVICLVGLLLAAGGFYLLLHLSAA